MNKHCQYCREGTNHTLSQCATASVSHLSVPALLSRVRNDRDGFFADADISALAAHPQGRLTQVLVRAGSCRFVCAAQDVAYLTWCMEEVGDYVRDLSIPVRDV